MPKVAEYKPMDIRFDNEEDYKEFVRWANDKSTVDEDGMIEMRKKIKKARQMKKRMPKSWPKK
ncbi:hypothetical protein F3157_20965 [Virgibacillus dakarensis]|uniref:Uncharacterized protein n=1 Tax=Lentibacillus populi TaxID=1827502 RepID=A0A9W5TZZ6_9BACI|nr:MULTISPECIES: hypothetical protein [Bacillaceae]MTW88069.1 hypothetical protein [Virgibacillus dakarensis]GGB53414.1 hypothetical protein GCM10011409_33760 [Lentibacillus populi]